MDTRGVAGLLLGDSAFLLVNELSGKIQDKQYFYLLNLAIPVSGSKTGQDLETGQEIVNF